MVKSLIGEIILTNNSSEKVSTVKCTDITFSNINQPRPKLIHTTHHPYPLHGGPHRLPCCLSLSVSTHQPFLDRKQSSQLPCLRIFHSLPLTIRSRSDGQLHMHNRILTLRVLQNPGRVFPDGQVRNVPHNVTSS